MATTFEFIIELRNVGRNLSDEGWEEIDAAHIKHWKDACVLLGTRHFDYQGHVVTLAVDWRPLLRRFQRLYRVMQQVHEAADSSAIVDAAKKFPKSEVKVFANLTARPEFPRREYFFESVLESFLYDVFLIMNIAAPGSCDFETATLRSRSERDSIRPRRHSKQEISLSSFYYELAYINGWEGKWPAPKMIDVERLSQWFFAIRSETLQIPRNRMEKVLFALFHIAKLDVSPTIVIWLFYALETLFDTKAGENFRILAERIEILLLPTNKEAKYLRKKLREMYNFRSGFVHGGLELAHPMHDDGLDPTVNEKYERLNDVAEFGFALLLTAIQTVIERNWRWLQFDEVMQGDPI